MKRANQKCVTEYNKLIIVTRMWRKLKYNKNAEIQIKPKAKTI